MLLTNRFIYLFLLISVFFTSAALSQTVCPICGSDGLCDLSVRNFNGKLGQISGTYKVNCVRVIKDGTQTGSLSSIKSEVNSYSNFVENASFGRLKLVIGSSTTYDFGSNKVSENTLVKYNDTLPNALFTVFLKPAGGGNSHAGGDHIWLTALRSLRHEAGHILGLGHSSSNMNGDFDSYGDSSSIMSAYPSLNYAVNQQHWLGWLNDSLAIKLNECLSKKPFVDVTLRPVATGGVAGEIPYTCVYEIPDSDQRIWVAIPKSVDSNLNGIKGGEIFIYRSDSKRGGCSGICMSSTLFGRIGNPRTAGPKEIFGLIIDPIDCNYTMVEFDGKQVPKYSDITLRIALSAQPPEPNDDPNDDSLIANWDFSEVAGTVIKGTSNTGLTFPATWNTDRTGIQTTGENTLLFSPTSNTIDSTCTYLDLAGAHSAVTSGKAWSMVTIKDFNFTGTPGERLRLGFTNALNNSPTAEFNLRRVADNSIHLMGFNGLTLPATGMEIYNSNTYEGLLEIMTEYNFDANTFEVFYRFDETGDFISIGAASTMRDGYKGNALRLTAGDTAGGGTGSWADAGQFLHIDRIYLTKVDPRVQNQPPMVSITNPENGDIFTPDSNIPIFAMADDTDGNVANVEFYRDGTLLGQVITPPDKSEIALLSKNAQIHGSTAQYNSTNNNIGNWKTVTDWVSWNANIQRAGTYEVWVNYSAKNDSANATYRVEMGDQQVFGTVVGTGIDWMTYESVCLGTVNIASAGQIAVNVKPQSKPQDPDWIAVMNLRDVTLIRLSSDEDKIYKYTWTHAPAGTYTLTAKATDDKGAINESEPIIIHVRNTQGDINGDNNVNGIDLRTMAQNWLVNNGRLRQVGQIIGQWDFAEGHGSSAFDVSGYNNTATLYDNASWLDGAICLDGTGDYLKTENNAVTLQLTDSYSIALKLNPIAAQADGAGIIAKCGIETPIAFNHWSVIFGSGSMTGKILAYNGMTSWDTGIRSSQIVGSWHHLAIVYGGGLMNSYLDGYPVKSSAFAALPVSADGHLKIGCDRLKTKYFKGLMDDVVILNYELLPNEIRQLASGSPFEPIDEILCIDKPSGDLNDDCKVDLRDYAELAANWLK